MIIAGGLYREEVIWPYWSRIYGSGGRAAAAVSSLSPGTRLVSYAHGGWADDARASMGAFGVDTDLREIEDDLSFHYLYPLGRSELRGYSGQQLPTLSAIGDVVLCFGFVEGDATITARRAIYDPQNAEEVLKFWNNGSRADQLAIVLNAFELETSVGRGGTAGAHDLMARCKADVVVVKDGPRGATAYDSSGEYWVPAYQAESIFKIGSGDVFSAAFAHFWGEARHDVREAADLASRAVSRYVATRNVQINRSELNDAVAAPMVTHGQIYLAGPFFNLAQRWLIEEAKRCLEDLDATVFSPVHLVGTSGTAKDIAQADLQGLEQSNAVLAIIDGEDAGTLFEVGYARKLGIPVVALAESPKPESLTMLEGSGCNVVNDFTTAVYRAMWAAAR